MGKACGQQEFGGFGRAKLMEWNIDEDDDDDLVMAMIRICRKKGNENSGVKLNNSSLFYMNGIKNGGRNIG
jgi:hypothetical protein